MNGFLKSGQDLLHAKNENDKLEIKNLMDTLEGKLKMILSQAPVRLLKLKFKQLETLLKIELKEAEIELNSYLDTLSRDDKMLSKIAEAYEKKFNNKSSEFFTKCQFYLNNLKNYSIELSDKKVETTVSSISVSYII